MTAVFPVDGRWAATYDGRATAEENWEERTGIAYAAADSPDSAEGVFTAQGQEPVARSPYGLGGLRYLSVLNTPDGGYRLYYEATRADGAHELRTELISPPARAGDRHGVGVS